MCHIFFPDYYETVNSFMIPLVVLYESAMTVFDTRHLLSSDFFVINASQYCGYKPDQKCLLLNRCLVAFTDQRMQLLFNGGVYQSALTITVPRCCLPMRGVIYQSVGVN